MRRPSLCCRLGGTLIRDPDSLVATKSQNELIGGIERKGGRLVRTMCTVVIAVDVEDSDGTLVAHALLCDTDDLLIVVRKRDALDGRRELPYKEALARLHRPEPHLVICRTRNEESRLCYWGR